MSNRSNGQAHGWCRFVLRAWMLAALVVIWVGAPGIARADTIVLQSGERIEGVIVDATRNTVFIRRAIGGMRQMPIQDIAEVRIGLDQGAEIAGQLLRWVEGVHEVRSGSEVVRVRAGRILTRERQVEASRQPRRALPPRALAPRLANLHTVEIPAPTAPEATPRAPLGRAEVKPVRTGTVEAAPVKDGTAAVAASRIATAKDSPGPHAAAVAGPSPAIATPAASAPAVKSGAGKIVAETAAAKVSAAAVTPVAEIKPASVAVSKAAAEIRAAAPEAAAVAEVTPAAVDRADRAAEAALDGIAAADAAADATATAAATDDAATDVADDDAVVMPLAATPPAEGDGRRLAVRASVGAAAADADDLVFRIELSRPAEQTVVLIYGTVDGTAVAGKDYEPQQGVVTLARGSRSADVHVPLIKNRRAREDVRFELFLTADPKVAEVVDQRISATVPAAN